MLPVVRAAEAEYDLDEILAYLDEHSPAAARKLVTDLEQRSRVLSHNPGMGRARDDLSPGLRSLAVGKYMVFYRVSDTEVRIVRIVLGSRDLPALFRDDDPS